MIGGLELVTVSGDTRQHFLGGAFALAESGGGELLGPARALQHGASCRLGVVLLDGLASRRDAALMERREDRARADGVHANALRRVVGGERPRQARDSSLGRVILQIAAA